MGRTAFDVLVKALVAAGFFFFLQTYLLKASVEVGLQWAAVAALGAGYIAWSQANRR